LCFFMITSSWTLLSILTAVVSENMISTTGKQEYEMKLACDEEDRAQHMRELRDLFRCIDITGDGLIQEDEFFAFLDCKENAIQCAKCCRVPVRCVKDLFKDLSAEGRQVDMQHFTECLVEAGKPVTEKSFIKLESKLDLLHQRQDAWFQLLEHSQQFSACPHNMTMPHVNDSVKTQQKDDNFCRKLETSMQKDYKLMLDRLQAHEVTAQEIVISLQQLHRFIADLQGSVTGLVKTQEIPGWHGEQIMAKL